MQEEKQDFKIEKNPKAFIDYSQTIDDVHEHLDNYNSKKKTIVLIVFDDIITDVETNDILSPILTELF